jgi:hypothetical protein
MSDVVRSVREIDEITYTLGPDEVRRAICAWLYDEHGGVFTQDTTLRFSEDGSVVVTTPFPREQEAA